MCKSQPQQRKMLFGFLRHLDEQKKSYGVKVTLRNRCLNQLGRGGRISSSKCIRASVKQFQKLRAGPEKNVLLVDPEKM